MYECLEPTRAYRRKNNRYYAEYFEWLYRKIEKKLKKVIPPPQDGA